MFNLSDFRTIILCSFLLFVSFGIRAQKSWNQIGTFQNKSDSSVLINRQAALLIKGAEIKLVNLSEPEKIVFKFSLPEMGNPSLVDASYPLKLMAYYKERMSLCWVDNKLALLGEPVNLEEIGLSQVTLLCNSLQGFWVFDKTNNELLKLGADFKVISRSGNLGNFISGQFAPTQMLERNRLIYINDPKKGIFVFDQFANFVKKIPLKDITCFEVVENGIYHVNNSALEFYSFGDYSQNKISGIDKPLKSFSMKGKLFLLRFDAAISLGSIE